MNLKMKPAAYAIALTLGISFAMSMMTNPAAAYWRHGCWGCGAFAAGAIAGAAVARPYYAPPYYYAPRPVVYPPYPVCPIGVNPWYCR
jgi:hypothetical protein